MTHRSPDSLRRRRFDQPAFVIDLFRRHLDGAAAAGTGADFAATNFSDLVHRPVLELLLLLMFFFFLSFVRLVPDLRHTPLTTFHLRSRLTCPNVNLRNFDDFAVLMPLYWCGT